MSWGVSARGRSEGKGRRRRKRKRECEQSPPGPQMKRGKSEHLYIRIISEYWDKKEMERKRGREKGGRGIDSEGVYDGLMLAEFRKRENEKKLD